MKRIIKLIIAIVLLICLYLFTDFVGFFKTSEIITIDIPVGTGTGQISELLKDNKVIRHPDLFTAYSIVNKAAFQSGKHTFDSKSYKNIFNELTKVSAIDGIVVTITEGMEQREIADLLEKKGVCSAIEFNEFAKPENFSDFWFLKDIPERKYALEGYLFPDTYEFVENASVEKIIRTMLENFDKKIDDNIKKQISGSNFTFDEIITLASVIEREAATSKDFKLVSGVFYNRLNYVGEGDGYLRSCATVQYILQERKNVLSIADTKINSPYNTYINEGLPVGPVASPGIETIKAALDPQKTDYVYFASDANGYIYYAKTYSEHQNNMRKAGL